MTSDRGPECSSLPRCGGARRHGGRRGAPRGRRHARAGAERRGGRQHGHPARRLAADARGVLRSARTVAAAARSRRQSESDRRARVRRRSPASRSRVLLDIAELLVAAGADVDAASADGRTPLSMAAAFNRGADGRVAPCSTVRRPTPATHPGLRPIDVANAMGATEAVAVLLVTAPVPDSAELRRGVKRQRGGGCGEHVSAGRAQRINTAAARCCSPA